jgi:hypothetical protein
MRLFFCMLLIGLAMAVQAQDCDCIKALDSVKQFIEKNYAGNRDKLTPASQKTYASYNARFYGLAKLAKTEAHCLYIIHSWTGFFRDHHIQVVPAQLTGQARTTEQKAVTPPEIKKIPKHFLPVEGIYHTADTTYRVALLKSENGFRHYAAVILDSKAAEWKKGDVKFELIRTGKKDFDVIWYDRAHYPSFGKLNFDGKNELPAMGWIKEGFKSVEKANQPLFEEEKRQTVFYKQLDASTGYLRITSFGGRFAKAIDSVVRTNMTSLYSNPYLIIDLRNNGGGSDFSYRPLRPLIYTQPVTEVGVDMLATEDVIASWEKILKDVDMPADTRDYVQKIIEKAKLHKGEMVNIYDDQIDTLHEVLINPQKIAIVINIKCASTTEQFLLEAIQSKKITLFGEHTMGVLDYANMREKDFYSPQYTLWYATTRSRRINIGKGIDNVGLLPQVHINLDQTGWLDRVLQELKKR